MLNDTIKITNELIMMLNHAKMICVLNKIDFDTESYICLRDSCIDHRVETEIYNVESLIYSAYLAKIEIINSKQKISNHTEFITELDNAIDNLYVLPTF
jgi:hypothetical protein